MNWDVNQFDLIVNAEDYFNFFDLTYEPQVLNVNRLHILKKFSQYINEIDAAASDVSKQERLSQYRVALKLAYEMFLSSTPLEQKLFKVFNQKPKNIVMLTEIHSE
jgi:nitrogenase-stabilizing/protective protein